MNTSPIAQAVVGGALLENAYSLDAANGREQEAYRRNLRQVVDGLEARFANCPGVSWNTPAGGFFVSVTVPFTADDDLLELSARRYRPAGVISAAGGWATLRMPTGAALSVLMIERAIALPG
ncbi:hypothetical protein AB0O68_34920 [Streptomyces sp. NPDC087512]|uniref:hypothetical protein n=1 Tax=Streptomyces sp. NPDC087512 TaxID=3155059 RepID=UPI003447C2FE